MRHALAKITESHLGALALRDDFTVRFSGVAFVTFTAVHLGGLAALWRYEHQPIWLAIPSLAFLLAFPFLTRGTFALETLAPLLFLYVILAARYTAIRVLFAREPYVDEASLADPRLVFFQVEVAALVSAAYVGLAQTARYARAELRSRIWVGVSAILLIAAFAWFAAETIGHRTRGATASDPYAYVQMAVDMATRGTPLHSFPLFKEIANLQIAWYPIQHVGYRLFSDTSGEAPTVWPIGGSVWIAGFYRALGEKGLYLATPVAAQLSLLAFAFLAWEYFREQSIVTRAAVTGISVALLATSWEQVDRSIVPLVDAQAQLFTILAILLTFYSLRSKRVLLFGFLTGLSLGIAYFIRHTQVLLAIPILFGSIRMPARARLQFLAPAAVAALLVALPDLYYHQLYFGGWLTPESNELALFSMSFFIPSARALSERFFAGNEFGYLIPFLLYGIYRAARDDARKFLVIATWVVALLVFHLPYVAIKMRDLLPEFPAVILLTASGMFALARDVRDALAPQSSFVKEGRSALLAMTLVPVVIFTSLLLPAMRTRLTIWRPFQPVKITFGYVTAAQRASFDQIAALTPPNAVVASTMNDGPIDLYAHRATFRLAVWTPAERGIFVEAMKRTGRAIFLLEDGKEMTDARLDLETRYRLKQIAMLDVPLFGEADLSSAVLWEVLP